MKHNMKNFCEVEQCPNEPIMPDVDEKTKGLLVLSGTWEDDRPVEAIIQDIYERRTVGKLNSLNRNQQ